MISTSVDPFIAVYADSNPFWVIELSDGRTIYQDDDRPELEEKSAWIRAKQYLDSNTGVRIERMKFRFSGYEHVVYDSELDNCIGLYFSKGASAILSVDKTKQWDFYVSGKVFNDNGLKMSVSRYEVPFLSFHDCMVREVTADAMRKIVIFNL